MNQDLDKQLCEKYPKIFKDRSGKVTETLMCWGFEHGDGWYDIIDNMCHAIQSHLDWKEQTRQNAINFNQMLEDAQHGDWRMFEEHHAKFNAEYVRKTRETFLENEPKTIPDPIPQVVAVQVKEKFGTLRFYYNGGDEYTHGISVMAEYMSATTCEECGSRGRRRPGGWIQTLCDTHARAAGKYDEEDDEHPIGF